MLVLSRRHLETIVIQPGTPEQVTIHVHSIRGQRVQLGIEAPAAVIVRRGEQLEPTPPAKAA